MKISYDQKVNKQHFPTVEIFFDLSSFLRLSCNVEEIPKLSRLSVSPIGREICTLKSIGKLCQGWDHLNPRPWDFDHRCSTS